MGLNQIATLNVPTSNGEGTASDLSTMAADKTIELSGTYVGRFVILGSHDGTLYVPLAILDSGGGAQAFKQVVRITTRYLKVLRKTSSGGTVVISVAAETTALNNYIALATLTAGATGPQASIDLWTLVASTGLEGGISFFGRGSLGGAIVIEGSLDNSNWNPLGEFDSGLLVGGEAMGFTPIVANEIVRYLRVNVVGVIGSGGFSITLGGLQNTTGDSGNAPADATYLTLSTNAQLVNERVFTVVQANGLTATDNGAGLTFTLTNNLITGLAGGQTVVGGTAANESLTLSSTTNGTKGLINFGGSTGFSYDEDLKILSIGKAVAAANVFEIYQPGPGDAPRMHFINDATGQAGGDGTYVGLDNNNFAITSLDGIVSIASFGALMFQLANNQMGFFGHAVASQGVSAADLTNNVTAGGVNDTIANYTDLTVYANDAAAIRNDIYQLARKLAQVNNALRAYGLLT